MNYIMFLLGLTLLSPALIPGKTYEIKPKEIEPPKVEQEMPPVLLAIAQCESGNRQFNRDGGVVRGRINPQDVGRWQINEYWHLKEANRLGFDIYTEAGNEGYALHLYNTLGTKPWNWSKSCWSEK